MTCWRKLPAAFRLPGRRIPRIPPIPIALGATGRATGLAVLLLCLPAPAGAQPAPTGPSPGEALAALTKLLDSRWERPAEAWRQAAQGLLSNTPADAAQGSELRAAIELALAIDTGAGQLTALPRSDRFLRTIRRGVLMPIPEAVAAQLVAADGAPPSARIERLRFIASCSTPDVARERLRQCLETGLAGRDSPELSLASASGLGRVGEIADAIRLALIVPVEYPGLGDCAARAVQAITDRLWASEDWAGLEQLELGLVERIPDRLDALVEAASVAVHTDSANARALLERLAQLPFSHSSDLRDARVDAALGQALLAIGRGEDGETWLAQALALVAPAAQRDRGAKNRRARAFLLRGLAAALKSDSERALAAFAEALREAPYEPDANLFSEVTWGPFGILPFLQHRLIGRGDAERAVTIAELLLEAQARDRKYLPENLDGENDDRFRTWLPLTIAQWRLAHLAQPERVEKTLYPVLKLTAGSVFFNNKALEAQCHLTQGDALCYLDDPQGALSEYQAAAKIYHDIEQEGLGWLLEAREHSLEAPLLAYRRVLEPWWYDDPAWTRWTPNQVHVELRLAFLEASFFHADERALAHVRRAHQLLPADDDVRLELARMLAKRGEPASSRRLLGCVEAFPQRLYNIARTYALMGEHALAVDCLDRYLHRALKTEVARQRQRRIARADPDLASIRTDPRFIELVQRD